MDGRSTTAKDTAPITARLTHEMLAELNRRAVEADRTLSAELRRAVRFYLEQQVAA